jgi:hypothetical protein
MDDGIIDCMVTLSACGTEGKYILKSVNISHCKIMLLEPSVI